MLYPDIGGVFPRKLYCLKFFLDYIPPEILSKISKHSQLFSIRINFHRKEHKNAFLESRD